MEDRALSKRTVLLMLTGIVVIAAGLRLYGLDTQSLWYDEVVEETAFKWQFLSNKSWYHIHPPLHSVIIHAMTIMFPGNDLALRIVPFSFGVISVPLLFLFGKRLIDENTALIAAFLLAISPFHIWYSQEVRSYALQWMLALVSLIFFLQALERPHRGNYIGYVLSTAAGFYTNQLTIFLVSLQVSYLLFFYKKYKSQLLKWLSAFSATIILYSPWIVYNAMIYSYRKSGSPKELDIKSILYTFYSYCAGFSIGPSLRELHINQSLTVIKPYFLLIGLVMTVYGIFFLLGLWSLRKNKSQLAIMLLILTIPIIGLIILNKVMPNISYNVRYTGTALFAFLLFTAKGINWLLIPKFKLSGKILAVFALVAVTGISTYSYYNYQFDNKYHKADFRSAANYLNNEVVSNDSVLCLINGGVLERYSKGGFRCSSFHTSAVADKDKLNAMMRKIVNGKSRIWLVLANEWYIDNITNVKNWLDSNYTELKQLHKGIYELANVRVYCYDLTKNKAL